jgi:iron-sulfur cluster assembly protein
MIASVDDREPGSGGEADPPREVAREVRASDAPRTPRYRYTLESLEAAYRSQTMITITDKGAEKVHEFLSSQEADVSMAGLRVGVRGGGCSGFQYQLAFDEQRSEDVVFESHGLKLLVDGESLPFVRGSTIDYEESLQGAGFKVSNPNVVAACGCGSSFRVAEEEQVSAV